MPAFAPIVLATLVPPVTMTPVRIKGDVAFYEDMNESVPELRKTLSLSLVPPSKTSKLYKMRCRVVLPVADPVTGAFSYSLTFDNTVLMPKESTTAARNGFYDLVMEAINSDPWGALFIDQQTIY